ncbi:serine hydrolase domain-containing protein [Pedobacter heparinus]|uniref:serine hydrolase domain-containing protein n=1 Tax=Pedobacter heparinus TaxID=984 RepID=UPI00292DE951|nr:serine hydrolase domain-containing protein [Pedobacter heparinus]
MKTKLDTVVDKAAKAYMAKSGRVGLSIGVLAGGGMHRYHYGKTVPGGANLPDNHSIYEMGSITKTFTGLLVARAIVEGKMELNADIRKYLGGNFLNLQYPGGEPVKLGYILAHTAQLPNSFPAGDETGFLQQLQAVKLDSLKSSKYAYSNVGYKLLGYALEQVYQMPYQELLVRHITHMLGMKDTRVAYAQKESPKLLKGFDKDGKEAAAIPAEMPGAGAIHSSLDDMLKYVAYQLSENDTAVKLSHRIIYGNVDQEARGFQWEIGKTRNWDYYFRADGGTEGFRTFCALYPNERIGIVLLSNQTDDSAGGGLYKIILAIINELKNK